MTKKKVLIIGAGIAGLSAGSYLQRNDYDTEKSLMTGFWVLRK